MPKPLIALLVVSMFVATAQAQWTLQNSNTTADLRGIENVGNGIAWASGTNGTVLRTLDNGKTWTQCVVPPNAEHLDFRGIRAFDADTAIVMSSGKGDLSRLYKTTDGCETWKLTFTDPYGPDGFFDAILFLDRDHGILLGDPTPNSFAVEDENAFRVRVTFDGGTTWGPVTSPDDARPGNGVHAAPGEAAFAASNSTIASIGGLFWFATSASRVASRRLLASRKDIQFLFQPAYCAGAIDAISGECGQPWTDFANFFAPIVHGNPSQGIFSIYFRNSEHGIAVGGDYLHADESNKVAALSPDGGRSWLPSVTPPHGYRSSVAYDADLKTWITVGPNGTDISTDDGRNWRAVRPNPDLHESPDADRNWNALSLPYVVGPHGRIGKFDPAALKTK